VQSPNHDRDARIIAAARLGQSHEAIAREHRISRPRVSQIVNAANPRSPEETQRQLIAERLRSRWDVLEEIVRRPPEQHSAIGKIVLGSDGKPVINASAVIAAVREQCKIEVQYRQMFGADLSTRPGPVFDEDERVKLAEIRAVQQYRATLAPATALPPLPAGYTTMTPEQQADADLTRRRVHLQAQQIAIDAARDDDVVDAEIID
jgi:hypothetical protein